jgi:hypothetical protein
MSFWSLIVAGLLSGPVVDDLIFLANAGSCGLAETA